MKFIRGLAGFKTAGAVLPTRLAVPRILHVRGRTTDMPVRQLGANHAIGTPLTGVRRNTAERSADADEQHQKAEVNGSTRAPIQYVRFQFHTTL